MRTSTGAKPTDRPTGFLVRQRLRDSESESEEDNCVHQKRTHAHNTHVCVLRERARAKGAQNTHRCVVHDRTERQSGVEGDPIIMAAANQLSRPGPIDASDDAAAQQAWLSRWQILCVCVFFCVTIIYDRNIACPHDY